MLYYIDFIDKVKKQNVSVKVFCWADEDWNSAGLTVVVASSPNNTFPPHAAAFWRDYFLIVLFYHSCLLKG